jgi:hypothetical protein
LSALFEKKLERNYLVISCAIIDNKNEISLCTMIDNDVTRYAFVNKNYTHSKNLFLYKLKQSHDLEIFDDRSTMSNDITHVVKV